MQQMKLVGLLFVGSLPPARCKKDDKTPAIQKNQLLAVKVNESAPFTQDVTFRVEDIADSRCPATAVCVWYSQAKVTFTLKYQRTSQRGELCLGQCDQQFNNRDSITLQSGAQSYQVILTEVRPYPGTNNATASEAVIEVKQP